MRWVTRAASLMLVATLCVACGGSSKSQPVNPAAAASQRLEGNWHLLSFEPSLAMEEPFRSLLQAQLHTLTISFSGGQFTAQGPNVNTTGRYEVTSAQGDSLAGRIYDSAGAGHDISGQFVGPQLRFISQGQTFAGTGVLERAK